MKLPARTQPWPHLSRTLMCSDEGAVKPLRECCLEGTMIFEPCDLLQSVRSGLKGGLPQINDSETS